MKIFKTQLLEAATVKSDSRAPDKLYKSLKEMLEWGKKIILYPFKGHCKQSNTVNTGLMLAPEAYTASEHYMYTGQEREVLVIWKVNWKKTGSLKLPISHLWKKYC